MDSGLFAPILIIIVSVPLILKMVPRNRFYGFRTPRTRSADAIWYPANRVAGILMTVAGLIWLGSVFLAPSLTESPRQIALYPVFIGVTAVLLGVLGSALYSARL